MLPSIITEKFFEPFSLQESDIYSLMAQITDSGCDLADIYLDYHQSQSWNLEDKIFKKNTYDAGYGAGIRAIKNELIGFSSTTDLRIKSLQHSAEKAQILLPFSERSRLLKQHFATPSMLFKHHQELLSAQEVEPFLQSCDSFARGLNQHCQQVILNLSLERQLVLIYREDGRICWDDRPMLRFNCTIVLQQPGKPPSSGYAAGGGRHDFMAWITSNQAFDIISEALRLAIVDSQAQPAPMGTMPVILGSGWPGVLIHEAVGHGLEADFIRKKSSIYHDKLGELVASPVCTIIDNGCIAGYRGSLGIDDEGEPTQSTTLIENGILKNFLFDRHQAFLMGTVSTGNGRRESALHCPMPRMTNTFLAAGQDSTAAMIESVPYGIYAVNFGGGSVDITSGQFVFSASEAYIIEKGQLKQPIKGATLIGNGPAVLKKISMVGHELRFDPGIGVCGKNGQGVPVTVGQPALKIDEIVVGGTNG